MLDPIFMIRSNDSRQFFFSKTTIRPNCISAKRRFHEMTFRENDVTPSDKWTFLKIEVIWLLQYKPEDTTTPRLHASSTKGRVVPLTVIGGRYKFITTLYEYLRFGHPHGKKYICEIYNFSSSKSGKNIFCRIERCI